MLRAGTASTPVRGACRPLLAALLLATLLLSAPPARALPDMALLEALRRGGLVVYFRHTKAVRDARPDAVAALPPRHEGCNDPGRPLSAAGVEQARTIGAAWERLGIPAGEVRTSPYCRCIETGWYAFGRAETDPALSGVLGDRGEAAERRVEALRGYLGQAPAEPGTNTVIVAHVSNMNRAAGLYLAEGEAAVFRPEGSEGYTLLGRVRADGWQ